MFSFQLIDYQLVIIISIEEKSSRFYKVLSFGSALVFCGLSLYKNEPSRYCAVGICYFEPSCERSNGWCKLCGWHSQTACSICLLKHKVNLSAEGLLLSNSTVAHSDPQASQARAVIGFLVADEGSGLKHKGTAMRKIEEL